MNEDWISKCIGNIDETYITEADDFQPKPQGRSYWKKIVKKWAIVILATGILLTLLLMWPPREYRLVKEQGTYCMYIDEKYMDSFLCDCQPHRGGISACKYDSLDAMEAEIRNGTFTAREFYWLGRYVEDGKIPIFDLDNMKDAVFPEGLTYYIEFFPYEYHICGKGENDLTLVRMMEISKDQFHQRMAEHNNFKKALQITDWTAGSNDPREAAPVFAVSGMNYRYYVIVTDTIRYFVREYDNGNADPAYRWSYLILGQADDGTYFELTIRHMQTRPDLDWLATFRLVDR